MLLEMYAGQCNSSFDIRRTSFEQRRCLVPPYGVRVIAFSSVASEFVPALLSVASQNPTATTTRAAIKTAR